MLKDYIKPYPDLVFDDDIFEPLRLSYASEVTNFPKKLDGLSVKSGMHPQRLHLNNDYDSMRAAVADYLEFLVPFPEKSVIFIVNAFGMFDGSEANRALNNDGQPLDIIFGDFLILGEDLKTGDFCSLPEDQFVFFEKMFFHPQIFVQENNQFLRKPFSESLVIKP